MAELTFYGLKTCDTCRKALKALEAHGHAVTNIDVRADGVPGAVLADWLAALGTETLVNTRSTTWRALDEANRARAGTPDGVVSLLLEHPTLMKRPVIAAGGKVHVGWSKDVQHALLD